MRTLASSLRLLVPCVGCWVLACSLDDRRLHGLEVVVLPNGGAGDAEENSGPPGGSGGFSGGDAAKGGTALAGSGGEGFGAFAGSQPAGGAAGDTSAGGTTGGGGLAGNAGTPSRCPDLDADGVLDCDETIALNGSFDRDATRWTPDPEVTLAWSATDASGNAASGSLASTATVVVQQGGSRLVTARQCLPLSGGMVYEFAVQASIPDATSSAHAALELVLFDGPSCAGTALDDKTSDYVGGPDWSVAALTYLTPAVSRSVSVRLVTIKPFEEPPVTVLFDDVLVHAD